MSENLSIPCITYREEDWLNVCGFIRFFPYQSTRVHTMKFKWPKWTEEQKQQELSVQQLIPIRGIDGGVVITEDFRLVQLLRVSSLNLDLMSHRELNEAMERYELFLRSLYFPVQTTIMSQPVDLGGYIRGLEAKRTGESTVKQQLLTGYIAYAKGIETSLTMIQRQRYIVVSEQIQGTTKQAYEESMMLLEQKRRHIKSGLEEIGLNIEETDSLDVIRYFHTLYDYEGSQHRPINDHLLYPYTTGGIARGVFEKE